MSAPAGPPNAPQTGAQGRGDAHLPPQDIASEKAVLGALMLGGDVSAIREILYTEDFYLPHHQWIFDAICSLDDDRVSHPDPIMVRDRMAQHRSLPNLIRTTGNTYLSDLATPEATPSVHNATAYAANVREMARKRLISTLSLKAYQAANNGVSADEAFAVIVEAINDAADRGRFAPRGPNARRLQVKAASAFEMKAPRWLREGTIPLGAITLLAGRESVGKSTLSAYFAARITRGELPGHHRGHPRSVIVYATEDSWEYTIVPRLVAAGADLDRVLHIEARDAKDRESIMSVPEDLDALAQVCEENDVAMLQLDPLMSLVGGKDSHKDSEIRQTLDPLAAFTRDTHVAALGLIHVNKSSTSDPLNSIMGSRAFSAVARSVLYAIKDPEIEEGQPDEFLLCHPKCNIGPKLPSERYRILGAHVEAADGTQVPTSKIAWDGEDGRSAADLMRTANSGVTGAPPAVAGAAEWMRAYLFACTDRTDSRARVMAAGIAAGHSESTLERARKTLGVQTARRGFPAEAFWSIGSGGVGPSGQTG